MRAGPIGVLTACLLGACTGRFTVPPEPDDDEGVRPRCGEVGERLTVTPVEATVGAGQLLVLSASGGTGEYRWSIARDASGAAVDPNAGVYVAGAPDPELDATVDQVLLEDRGCRGDALASITVISAPRIAPGRVGLERGEAVTFAGAGGSGSYDFEIVVNASGGAVTMGGRYTAGAELGRDVVRLTDLELGSTADAIVEVVEDAALSLEPTAWVIPLDSTAQLPVSGGSGEYDVAVSSGAVAHLDGATVRAEATGAADVTFTDRFTGRSLVASVRVVAPHTASRRHGGDRSESQAVVGGHDFDGDGFVDLAVGLPDASGDWHDAGKVLIYRGNTAGGLDPTPARVISGRSRDEEFGRGLAVGDLDHDGLVDLVVGARRADPIARDVGAVHVYAGRGDGELFSDAPTRSFFGSSSFDLFGHAIALCDFNADGRLDLAASAPYGQEPGEGTRDQGVIGVFLARPEGGRDDDAAPSVFISAPDVRLAGQQNGDGPWAPFENQRLGEALAAGDFDGDGVCDLAAYGRGTNFEDYESGVVYVFRGRAADGSDPGGPARVPSLRWGRVDGVDDNARFGLSLALGDVNGDGRADLLASRFLHDGAGGTDTGALYLLYGRALPDEATAITDVSAADWSVEGVDAYDRTGMSATLADVNLDGYADVVSGDARASVPESERSRPGVVRVYAGAGAGLPTTPTRAYEGAQEGEWFGVGVGALGDLDGDGWSELATFAPYHDSGTDLNDDRGILYLQWSDARLEELEVARPPSGQRVGESVAWLGDLDGDGFSELAVGASQTDIDDVGRDVGTVRIYRGTANGVSPTPIQQLADFIDHGDSDEFGRVVAPAGDFDGDGAIDLAVLARSEDLPSELATDAWVAGPGCTESRSNSAAVLVFSGNGDGTFDAAPSFVIFGPESNQRIETVAALDADGDGRSDLLLGGRDWDRGANDAGGFALVLGRDASGDGRPVAVCEPDERIDGGEEGAHLGAAVAVLGRLDGDGCDDWAVGAPEADPSDTRNAGEVRVYFGWGTACATTTPRSARLYGRDRDSQGGSSLFGGVDFDGDRAPDLLIGAPAFRDGRGEVGRVILVSGAYALSLEGAAGPFVEAGSDARLAVDGRSPGERLGESLSGAPLPGGGAVAVLGGPSGGAAGRVDAGGALVLGTDAAGFSARPRLQVAGESSGESQLGASVSAIRVGGRVMIAVGAPWSGAVEIDDGASYAFALE